MNTALSKPDSVSTVNRTPEAPTSDLHHPLDARGERDVVVVEAVVDAVSDRPVVVQRGEHAADRGEDVLDAADVQERLLLTGEGRVRQVFCGRARPHRPRHRLRLRITVDQSRVSGPDVGLERSRQRLLLDPLTNCGADVRELCDVADIERLDGPADALVEAIGGEELAVSICRRREPARDADPGVREIAHHLAERGVLAADLCDVGHADLGEPEDVVRHIVSRSVGRGRGGRWIGKVNCVGAWTA